MLHNGTSISEISEITGLTKEEITKVKITLINLLHYIIYYFNDFYNPKLTFLSKSLSNTLLLHHF